MITCSRKIHFCAGHRVYGHENKCANLHGHNYVAWIKARGQLDSIGRIIDFSVLKNRIGEWIENNWDHNFILYKYDPIVSILTEIKQPKHIFLMSKNPTAENMAEYLLDSICPEQLANTGVEIVGVKIYETENCVATAVLN